MKRRTVDTGIRLLVVDDERLMRMSLRVVLGEAGYSVDTAKSVAEALDMLDRFIYQVLITDLDLPDGSGAEIIRHGRQVNARLQAILLTGGDDPAEENAALSAGAGAVIHKPCELSRVVHATSRAMAGASGSTSRGTA